MAELKQIEGGVTAARGYKACGVAAGIKRCDRADMALLTSVTPAACAGVFTTNRIQGATVRLCRDHLSHGIASAVVVNSGNANACNGEQGRRDAARMATVTAERLALSAESVMVCSTGVIGVAMPMEKIERGIEAAVDQLVADGGPAAARAIMTTDTVPKQAAVEFMAGDRAVRVGGMAKGSGMIEPNMATMLAFITTDAAVAADALQRCLNAAVADSFNKISVDGDQSCNDTVLLLANGASGGPALDEAQPVWALFTAAVKQVALSLARQIVRDGEGATKFVTVRVLGAACAADARRAARAIANSLLVKTSWFGCDPNWGRVIDAVGYSGAGVVEEKVNISFDDLQAVVGGRVSGAPLKRLEEVLARPEFCVTVNLNLGDAADVVYTCDCSQEYVRINSEYTT